MINHFTKLPRFRMLGIDRFVASCPTSAHGHGDRSRGLSGRILNDKIIIKCFTGCSNSEILKAMGLDWSALFKNKSSRRTQAGRQKEMARAGLEAWRQHELLRCAQELRLRDSWIAIVNHAVNFGHIETNEGMELLVYPMSGDWSTPREGYSDLERRFEQLLSDECVLPLWRESRRVP